MVFTVYTLAGHCTPCCLRSLRLMVHNNNVSQWDVSSRTRRSDNYGARLNPRLLSGSPPCVCCSGPSDCEADTQHTLSPSSTYTPNASDAQQQEARHQGAESRRLNGAGKKKPYRLSLSDVSRFGPTETRGTLAFWRAVIVCPQAVVIMRSDLGHACRVSKFTRGVLH